MDVPTAPPPGKAWLTVEMTSQQVTDLADVDLWDLDVINEVHGREPKSADELLREAADAFRFASKPDGGPHRIPDALSKMADAVDALRKATA